MPTYSRSSLRSQLIQSTSSSAILRTEWTPAAAVSEAEQYIITITQTTPIPLELLQELSSLKGSVLQNLEANIFMFGAIEFFDWWKNTAANLGWVPFTRPLIWCKSESEGLAPWGGSGPQITTEFIFYATKGQRGLNASPINVFRIKRVPRNARIHAAEKPVELLSQLIECSTIPGELVLDPCCGSGSTLVACRKTKRRGLGIEKGGNLLQHRNAKRTQWQRNCSRERRDRTKRR